MLAVIYFPYALSPRPAFARLSRNAASSSARSPESLRESVYEGSITANATLCIHTRIRIHTYTRMYRVSRSSEQRITRGSGRGERKSPTLLVDIHCNYGLADNTRNCVSGVSGETFA